MGVETKPNSYAWTSPYAGFWVEHFYQKHFENLYGRKIIRQADLIRRFASNNLRPEIMLMGNFIRDRVGIVSLCRDAGINTVHGEDGFFPHYTTMHADPLGFCWESSLCRMAFRSVTNDQRKQAQIARKKWLDFKLEEIDGRIRHPFVLWPLQLIGDRVNVCDLNLTRWDALIEHFRECLPREFQLVVKLHPRANAKDFVGLSELVQRDSSIIFLNKNQPLKSLLYRASAVAGVNSSVLYEARLMFGKPTYAYGRGWFTNHEQLFYPMSTMDVRELSRVDILLKEKKVMNEFRNEYMDWFLYQLLSRQIDRGLGENNPNGFKKAVYHRSYEMFQKYGEEIF